MNTCLFRGRAPELLVTSQRVELMFDDHSRAQLHNVLTGGQVQRYLRAVPHAAGEHIVDLRDLVPELGEDLCTTEPADVPYLLCTTFRLRYPSADAFMAEVVQHHLQASEAAV